MQSARHQSYFLPMLGLLLALAWIVLWTWEQSPYSRYLEHGSFGALNLDSPICRAFAAGAFRDAVLPGLLFVVGWVLMTAAMMLPTSLPLLEIFRRLTRSRPDAKLLIGLLIAGYLAVWAGFGVVAHGLYLGLFAVAPDEAWLAAHGWIFGAATLGLAGIFQFSELKYRCLDKCRTPMSFVIERWRGRAERWNALRLGVDHGLFCVGCCWALMLLMFVVGVGSVGWMLVLGTVMAAEKNLPWGRRLAPPLGFALIAWAGWIVYAELSPALL